MLQHACLISYHGGFVKITVAHRDYEIHHDTKQLAMKKQLLHGKTNEATA